MDYDNDRKCYDEILRSRKDLECSLNEIRSLGDDLKESPAYHKYGYVTKSDLIDVYKSKKDSKGDEESLDDDILLMIQAPPGARIDVP
jgi:hypothetical protein